MHSPSQRINDQLNRKNALDAQRFARAANLLARLGPELASLQTPLTQALTEVPDAGKAQILHFFWLMGWAGPNSRSDVANCLYSTHANVRNDAVTTLEARTPADSPDPDLLRKAVAQRRLRAVRGISALAKRNGQFRDLLPIVSGELSTKFTNRAEALTGRKTTEKKAELNWNERNQGQLTPWATTRSRDNDN